MWLPAHKSTNHDAPFVEKDYCGRPIAFAARKRVVCSGKNCGVVTPNVSRNCCTTNEGELK